MAVGAAGHSVHRGEVVSLRAGRKYQELVFGVVAHLVYGDDCGEGHLEESQL